METQNFIYTEIKRKQIDRCNICGRKSILGWDHVPPQGGIDLSSVEIRSILQRIAPDKNRNKFLLSQNGLKYRTLCGDCNNKLGREYDPILNKFAREVGSFMKTAINLTTAVQFKTKPNVLIRAILGHMLAAKAHYDDVLTDEAFRSFLFDTCATLPKDIYVFYWVYPFQSIVVLRNVLMLAVRGQFDEVASFDILKYFPVGYLVTDKPKYEYLSELSAFRNLDTFADGEVPIDFHSIYEPDWPEKIDDGNVLLGGQSLASSVYAIPRKKKS